MRYSILLSLLDKPHAQCGAHNIAQPHNRISAIWYNI
jgi:hypothetical protein